MNDLIMLVEIRRPRLSIGIQKELPLNSVWSVHACNQADVDIHGRDIVYTLCVNDVDRPGVNIGLFIDWDHLHNFIVRYLNYILVAVVHVVDT